MKIPTYYLAKIFIKYVHSTECTFGRPNFHGDVMNIGRASRSNHASLKSFACNITIHYFSPQ